MRGHLLNLGLALPKLKLCAAVYSNAELGKRGRVESHNPFYPSLAFRAEFALGRCSGNPVKDVTLPGTGAAAARVTEAHFLSLRQFAWYSLCCCKLFMHWLMRFLWMREQQQLIYQHFGKVWFQNSTIYLSSFIIVVSEKLFCFYICYVLLWVCFTACVAVQVLIVTKSVFPRFHYWL